MWSCPGNMPTYFTGLRDIWEGNMSLRPGEYVGILPGQDHINIIIILSV